jgi:hypothetical protein
MQVLCAEMNFIEVAVVFKSALNAENSGHFL